MRSLHLRISPRRRKRRRFRRGGDSVASFASRLAKPCPLAAGGAGRGGVDDGAGVRGVGRQERRRAGLFHGLLQDPRDAQAEQARALQGQPRRRRGPPPAQTAAAKGAAAAPALQGRRRRGRRRPTPAAPRQLPHGKEEVP